MTDSMSDLPLEMIAMVLELVDYRSLACFEIAMPSSTNIVRWWKTKRLRIEIRKPDLCINGQFMVRYHRAIACLQWIKARTQLSTLHVTYTQQALRHYKRKLKLGKLNSPYVVQYTKIVNFLDVWSMDVYHFIANISPSYFPDQVGVFSCIPESTATDNMTISYRPALKEHVCYLPTDCEKDKLLALPEYSIRNIRSTFDLFGSIDSAVIKFLLHCRKPKELRFLGHVYRFPLYIFPETGPVAMSVEKIVMYMLYDYELYTWDDDATGLHTWFPSLKECTLIDPTFPRDLQHIWSVVTKFLDANRSLLLNLVLLSCSRVPEQSTFHLISNMAMVRMFKALTLGTEIASTEFDDRAEIVFKRLDMADDAAAVHITFD